jgi:DNA-binding MarR family transcriptional regulator
MNAIMFGCKRGFHSCLRVTRKQLQKHGLTAARFDMLFALLQRPKAFPSRPQRELRELLGVSSPVISRMLRSLEKLGWVVRGRFDYGCDRRQKWVKLTDAGRERIEGAHKKLVPRAMRLVSKAVSFGNLRNAFLNMCNLESYLRGMRTEFGDHARLHYPWHPDD